MANQIWRRLSPSLFMYVSIALLFVFLSFYIRKTYLNARENLQKALLELKKKPPPPKKEEKKDQKKQDPKQQPKKQPQSKMSPKEAEQRLKLLSQKEKEVQQRMQQAKSRTGGGQPKDW